LNAGDLRQLLLFTMKERVIDGKKVALDICNLIGSECFPEYARTDRASDDSNDRDGTLDYEKLRWLYCPYCYKYMVDGNLARRQYFTN